MPESLLKYIEWIELESFFSGYSLVYAIIYMVTINRAGANAEKTRLPNLPLAYALTGTLYWGLQLKNMYPDYNIGHFIAGSQLLVLKIWGLLSIFFWLPVLRKKPVYSLLHSLVFFFLLIKSLFLQLIHPAGNEPSWNNIKIYSASILLNLVALALVTLTSVLIARFKVQKRSAQ